MEIEKKFLISKLPEDLCEFPYVEIEQAYLSVKPVIRIRRWNEDYILTYKNHQETDDIQDVCVNQEIELPLTQEAYRHLLSKADGYVITKRRYLIPYQQKTIELDVFSGRYEGLVVAEIEFDSMEEANGFSVPSWFQKNVSGDIHYSNAYLALNGISE